MCVSRICQAAQTFDAGDGDSGDAGEDPAWGCVGKVPILPESERDPVELEVVMLNQFPKGPLPNLPLKLCRITDTSCTAPVKEITTNEEGIAKLPVYTGFRGFLQFTGSTEYPNLYPFISYVPIVNPEIPATKERTYLTVFDKLTVTVLAQPLGVEIDDKLGQLIFTARDCQNALGTDVVALTNSVTATSKTWYLDSNGSPNPDQRQTSVPGVGGIFNVAKGFLTLRYEREGKRVGEQTVLMREGAVTYMTAIPTP